MGGLRHSELTYQLRSAIFDVRKELKTGWPEEVYHQALVQVLQERQIPVVSKERMKVKHRGREVHVFESDIIAWGKIILELKVLPHTDFAAAHRAQIIHYLKCWQKDLGLLVNFGKNKLQIFGVTSA